MVTVLQVLRNYSKAKLEQALAHGKDNPNFSKYHFVQLPYAKLQNGSKYHHCQLRCSMLLWSSDQPDPLPGGLSLALCCLQTLFLSSVSPDPGLVGSLVGCRFDHCAFRDSHPLWH